LISVLCKEHAISSSLPLETFFFYLMMSWKKNVLESTFYK